MTYPILEFDSTPEAFIEPSKLIRALDLPEHCVICFFREVIDKVIAEYHAKAVVEYKWEDGPHRIYEFRIMASGWRSSIRAWARLSRLGCSKKPLPMAAGSSWRAEGVASSKKILRSVT
jgi:hypothetical protein